ncbi:hypothetical protein HN51_061637 [Arachis hypogaea]|nr:Stigma-specific STIG1-like protein [Arachis hypogaea]
MFMMDKHNLATLLVTLILGLALIQIEGSSMANTLNQNDITSVSSSPWLKKVVKRRHSYYGGCRMRPWVCNNNGEFPPRSTCCGNRCVNVVSDRNNCGACGIRCAFNRQCCFGLCRDINWSILNCGKCGHRCPYGVLCVFGMCGYGDAPKQKPPLLLEKEKI